MDLFWNIPIIIKVVAVFSLILVLIRHKYQLGTALLAGSFLLGFWCQMSPGEIVRSIGTTMLDLKTILLSAVVVLILILSRSLDTFDQMKRLLTSFQGLVRNAKFNLVLFPALIGLLPMPGGAIFSAPMVDELGNDHQLDPETKSLINYWFRHVWEFAWPLYPGVLLASSMASVSVWAFVSRSFPLTLISISAGYIFLLRNIPSSPLVKTKKMKKTQFQAFLKEMIPIVFVLVGALSGSACIAWLQRYIPELAGIPTELPLILSLIFSILYVWVVNEASGPAIRSILLNKALLKMIYMITAIYIFKEILVASRAVIDLSTFLADQHIPLVLVILLIPFIVGSIGGIAVAFVGTTFPVLLSLLQVLRIEPHAILSYLVLGFCAGFVGVMVSPLHVCLVFTQEYFKSDFRMLYQRLWKPLTVLMLGGIIYFSFLVLFGG
jgi:hypothetical protein